MSDKIEIVPGKYRGIKNFRILKELTHADKKNSDGTIARTFGTWAKPENFYYFSTEQATYLNENDLKNASIVDAIKRGTIYRVL